ncbi:glycogen debranching protein GlgX [Oxyplasma meridianum]|uniref:Glycogen debranching protein GlgX n=1 Tax=Oxyplasma meridianum TaxID=3073602 RepID=A0AAX4NFY5_9ARCH
MLKIKSGSANIQGATVEESGTNFALFSENGTAVDLEIYSHRDDGDPKEIIKLKERDGFVWHAFVSGIGPGTLYGYRVDGPYKPQEGHRFNRNKLLIDPYAKGISNPVHWNNDIFAYNFGDPDADLSFNANDDAKYVPKSVVMNDNFDWKGVRNPGFPWNKTVIYETHVKGFTVAREDIGENIRGTYLGLSSPKMVQYLKDLGITAVELMPVHHKIDSDYLINKGLSNYWGYNTIGYLAPDIRYASSDVPGEQINEFKNMVKTLHENSIEVILDVVYNHTGEGNHLGPTLSFKGIDNAIYYRLDPNNPRYYYDVTGTGNSLDAGHPQVLKLIMDSLRYWVTEMHVDGFRFDLAAALARQLYDVDRLSAFFDIIYQDPVISRVKLIAEPWDIGPGGYQVGGFPTLWAEWNGKYRDSIRKFWKERGNMIGEFATRISGSPDLYESNGRKPHSSINYITSHDGFTMYDLVSYSSKHNEANGEDNKDGTDDNISENFGVEGDTEDPNILRMREKRIRSLFITLLTSQGSPMILGGDEIMRTQKGNNNAYCQDNEISWYNWKLDQNKIDLYNFVKNLIEIKMKFHVLRRKNFFQGEVMPGTDTKDVTWVKNDGVEMGMDDWNSGKVRGLGVVLSSAGIEEAGNGDDISNNNLMLLFNPTDTDMEFTIPEKWEKTDMIIDSIPEHKGIFPLRINSHKVKMEGGSAAILMESSD